MKSKKFLGLALAVLMTLSACSVSTISSSKNNTNKSNIIQAQKNQENSNENFSDSRLNDLVLAKLSSVSTFCHVFCSTTAEGEYISNIYDGLLECSNKGELKPGLATEWNTPDGGKTWIFKLRDNCTWVDYQGTVKANCTAHDFATGIEFGLNFHKGQGSFNKNIISLIEGAQEYYDYTKNLSKEEAYALTAADGSKFREMVGVDVKNNYTLIFTCVDQTTFFPSLGLTNGLTPIPQGIIDELGVEEYIAATYDKIWYNGPYTITTHIPNNETVFTKNKSYWDKNCSLFNTVTYKIVESNEKAYQMYENGEIDYVQLSESTMKAIHDDPNHKFHDQLVEDLVARFAYSIHWNFNKNNEDGTPDTNWNAAVANEAFRLSWYYGLDLSDFYKRYNAVNPMKLENLTFTMKNMVYTPNGTDYVDLVKEKLALPQPDEKKQTRLNNEKFTAYKKQAIEELSAKGVMFPITAVTYCAGNNQTELDSLLVLKDAISKCLGDDFVKLEIRSFVSSRSDEVLIPRLQSFMINGWGADYADPSNFHNAVALDGSGWYSELFNNIATVEESEITKDLLDSYHEYDKLCKKAATLTDLNQRYDAYAEAEAYLISHGLLIPCRYDMSWCLTKINPYSKMYAMYGSAAQKIKNWESNKNGYTYEMMEKIIMEQK